MSYEVLARKWRPQTFQDVIGQEHISQTLMNAIRTGRLAHAYLFGGPRGIGKTSVARILAKAINCKQGEPGIPCNKCQSCKEITDGTSVDVQEIDGASNRGIDEIRELRDSTKYMPSSSDYRIYIIDEVHMLTMQAFNALLKTLEEPPAHVKFIFATTETHKVPITILSRCQRFDFKKITPPLIIAHLKKILKSEDIEMNESGLAMIARESGGCMRDAQSLLDQVIAFAGVKAEDDDITEILGIIDREIIFEASRAIIEGDAGKCLEIVERIYKYGHDIKKFYSTLMEQFRNLLVSVLTSQRNLLDMNESEKKEARQQAEQAGSEKLQILLNFMITREQDLRFTSNSRLLLEATMIKLCSLGDFLSFSDLMEKIGGLEKRLMAAASSGSQLQADQISDPGAQWVSKKPEQIISRKEEPPAVPREDKTEQKVKAEREVKIKEEEVKEQTGLQEETEFQKDTGFQEQSNLDWDAFLKFLGTKSRSMFNVIKDWEILNLTSESVKIAKSKLSFSASYFDDKDRYEQLTSLGRDFFKRKIKIQFVAVSTRETKNKSMAEKEQAQGSKTTDDSDLPQPVQDIINMFQGELQPRGKTN